MNPREFIDGGQPCRSGPTLFRESRSLKLLSDRLQSLGPLSMFSRFVVEKSIIGVKDCHDSRFVCDVISTVIGIRKRYMRRILPSTIQLVQSVEEIVDRRVLVAFVDRILQQPTNAAGTCDILGCEEYLSSASVSNL